MSDDELPSQPPLSNEAINLGLLESASGDPLAKYEEDDEVQAAFDEELRNLAEEIVQYHPSLTQLLLSLSKTPDDNPIHGRN